ncbi:MAG: response regulator [Gemmatimonadetes bacterium]|nr:response regulator [Gemmatimonadota bacterium]NIO32757.1 response regulator [Gemmatimonadota bacterium]
MDETRTAVIVDDERLARRELGSLLEAHPEVRIVGEADSVASAADLINREEPDLVFLDIQLVGETGFDLFELLETEPVVVFVTAYEQHAMRAFEVNALDYLLKPVTPERLAAALQKVAAERPVAMAMEQLDYQDRLFLRLDDRMTFLSVDAIKYITAAADYSYLHTVDGMRRLVHKSLKDWEARLPVNHFLRIHRSTIVNMEHIERLEPWSNYSYLVYLAGVGEPLSMSRRYALKAKDRLG